MSAEPASCVDADATVTDSLLHHTSVTSSPSLPEVPTQTIRRKPVPLRQYTTDVPGEQYGLLEQPSPLKQHATATPTESNPIRSGWQPFYLQRHVLLVFVALFLALLVALQVIYRVSERDNGLVVSVESRHYLWKYGPTAIIVTIGAFWARVTYQMKLVQPWIDLAKGPHNASRTVLADYVSVWEPSALVKSFVHRHLLVTIVILCALLFKLLTVVSTALILGERIAVLRSNIEFQADTFRDDASGLANVGSLPLLAIAGALNASVGWPSGTSQDYAFQTFNASSLPYDSSLDARVDVFSGSLECSLANNSFANWTVMTFYDPSPRRRGFTSEMDFVTNDCSIKLGNETDFDLSMLASDDLNTTMWRWTKFTPVYCGDSADKASGRILISVGELAARHEAEVNTYLSPDPNAPYYWGTATLDVTRSTTLLCRPLYDIAKLSVTLTADKSGASVGATIIPATNAATEHRLLDRVHAWDILLALNSSVAAAQSPGDQSFPEPYPDDDRMAVELALRVGMRLRSSANPTRDELFDQAVLHDISERVYRTFSAQVAHIALIDHTSSPITGNATVNEYRLIVQPVPVWVMSAMLVVMTIAATIAAFLSPRVALAPSNPSTIPGFAPIAAKSSELMLLLGRDTFVEFSQPAHLVSSGLYSSTAFQTGNSPYSIKVQQQHGNDVKPPSSRSLQFQWFQPLVLKLYLQVPVFVLVIAVVVALESLLSHSHQNNGLGSIARGSSLEYFWAYAPAVTMVLLGIYFSGVDVSVRTLAPYHKLRQACHWQTILYNLVDRSSVCAAIDAVCSSDWAVLMTTVAAVLGSLLTIVVSGVYSTEIQSSVAQVSVNVDSWFPYTNVYNTKDPGSMAAGLILNANASYPAWTYENLALASVSLKSDNTSRGDRSLTNDSRLVIKIPAIRPYYECRIYTDDELTVNFTAGPMIDTTRNLSNPLIVTAHLDVCVTDQPALGLNYTMEDAIERTGLVLSTTPNSYFGVLTQGWPACSDQLLMWGKMDTTGVQSLSVAACNSSTTKGIAFEQLLVEVTLLGPNLQIDERSPPRPDESTVQNLDSQDLSHIAQDVLGDITPTDSLDKFFSALVYGRYGIAQETLGNRGNDGIVMDAIYRQMQIIQTQQAAANWRAAANESNSNITLSYEGTLQNMDRTVLIQNATSTHILAVLLSVMLVLTVASTILMDTRHILPFEPTTIAAIASLLAHSNIIERDTLMELEMDSTRKEKDVAPRRMIKLGWFDDHGRILDDPLKKGADVRQSVDNAVFTINAVDRSSWEQYLKDNNSRSSIYSRVRSSIIGGTGKKTVEVKEEEVDDSR